MSKRLDTNLKNTAKKWASEITKLAKSFAPSHLRGGISTRSIVTGQGTYALETVAVGDDAAAQEHGSGERKRDRRRKRARYPIRPKPGNKYLAFNWEVANQNPEKFTFLDDGRVILPQVMHPGIHPYKSPGAPVEGYIRPAYALIRKKARKELSHDMYTAIIGDLRQAFKEPKK